MVKKKEQPYTSKLKGVSALLGEASINKESSASSHLPVEVIQKSSYQPRRYFEPQQQEQLVLSVKKHGILEPLLVRPLETGKYELVAGERRYRAALEVGLKEVPIIVKELTEQEALQLALIENLQRVDLNPVEETEGILQLLSVQLEQEPKEVVGLLYRMQNETKGKVTQNVLGSQEAEKVKEVFEALGIISWESFVNSRLSLLNLPEDILNAIRQGKIAYTKAQVIARIKDLIQRQKLLDESIANNLSLSQIKEKIKGLSSKNQSVTLKDKMKQASKRLYSSKCWNDPKKLKKLEKLVAQIEALLTD